MEVIWIQLHYFPMEYWDEKVLEHIKLQFDQILKIDEHTLSVSGAKFTRLCIEIDLSKPLKQGI